MEMAIFKLTPPFLSSHNRISVQMQQVLFALLPAIIAMVYFFGPAVLINIILAVSLALLAEAILLKLRNRPVIPFLTDGSAIVTGVLLALVIPPLTPWWATAVGIVFAIVFAKQLYGGLGYNPFNPAMAGYVLLLLSFPLEMTTWLPAKNLVEHPVSLFDSWQLIFHGVNSDGQTADMISGATPLDNMKTQIGQNFDARLIMNQSLFGMAGGIGWEWVNIWFAAGGLYLIYQRVISWHVPLAMLGSLLCISSVLFLIAPHNTASPLFHLLSGGTMMGAFFIATDPVSGSTTLKGRLIFGAGVGLLTYIIRVWGGYPDGIAFSVLLMNMLVPLIDYYTQPTIYGANK